MSAFTVLAFETYIKAAKYVVSRALPNSKFDIRHLKANNRTDNRQKTRVFQESPAINESKFPDSKALQ